MKRILMLLSLLILKLNINSMENPQDIGSLTEKEAKLLAYLNPRKLLGLKNTINLTPNDINKAYKNLSLIWHSDKNESPKSGYIFNCIKLAYNNLMGKKIDINEIDNYIIIKKLIEALNKSEANRAIIDNILLILAKENNINLNKENIENNAYLLNIVENNDLNKIASYLRLVLEITNYFIKLDIKSFIINDGLNLLNELNRIRVLASKDSRNIKIAAKIGKIIHILSIIKFFPQTLALGTKLGLDTLSKQIIKEFNLDVSPGDFSKLDKLADLIDLLPSLSAFKFLAKDNQIIKNAEKIAAYNKDNNINLKSTKLKQVAWLAINKIAPYLGFAFIRRTEDKASLGEIFDREEIFHSKNPNLYQLFHIIKSFSNISEIVRKHYRYKAELSSIK